MVLGRSGSIWSHQKMITLSVITLSDFNILTASNLREWELDSLQVLQGKLKNNFEYLQPKFVVKLRTEWS
jgi:hypothetical protein